MLDKHKFTAEIFNLDCPFDNQYQGHYTRLLFVCSAGMLRSPTMAEQAIKMGYNARSCGSADYALIPISVNLVHWAKKIFFVEEVNFLESNDRFFGDKETQEMMLNKSVILEIEDYHDFRSLGLQQQAVKILEDKMLTL